MSARVLDPVAVALLALTACLGGCPTANQPIVASDFDGNWQILQVADRPVVICVSIRNGAIDRWDRFCDGTAENIGTAPQISVSDGQVVFYVTYVDEPGVESTYALGVMDDGSLSGVFTSSDVVLFGTVVMSRM